MFKSKWLIVLVLTLFAASVLAGCGGGQQAAPPAPTPGAGTELQGSITIAGSTSVQPVSEELAKAFMTKHPKVTVSVQGGGSSQGIKAAIDGIADIGASSRKLKDDEAAQVHQTLICSDGIAVIIHPSNEVSGLTLEQVKKIYAGEITNWKEVGGRDKAIAVVTREEGSGTRGAFEEIVMGKEAKIWARAIVQPSSGGVKAAVAGNPDAIGYTSLGYLDDSVKTVEVDGVAPTAENIRNGSYKISRPFLYLTRGEPSGPVKEYIDFCLGPEGQEIVAQDYIPLK
ncbi:MAG: phosphate ABC transporter substrate-binding protein [Bacillota bacterium]